MEPSKRKTHKHANGIVTAHSQHQSSSVVSPESCSRLWKGGEALSCWTCIACICVSTCGHAAYGHDRALRSSVTLKRSTCRCCVQLQHGFQLPRQGSMCMILQKRTWRCCERIPQAALPRAGARCSGGWCMVQAPGDALCCWANARLSLSRHARRAGRETAAQPELDTAVGLPVIA